MKINLLPDIPKTIRYKWHGIFAIGAIILLLSAFATSQIWQGFKLLEVKKHTLEQVKLEVSQKKASLNQSQENSKSFDAYLDNYYFLSDNHVNMVPFMDNISQLLPNTGILSYLKWSQSEGTFEVTGIFRSLDQVGAYIQLLEELDWVKRVELKSIRAKTETEFKLVVLIDQDAFLKKGVME